MCIKFIHRRRFAFHPSLQDRSFPVLIVRYVEEAHSLPSPALISNIFQDPSLLNQCPREHYLFLFLIPVKNGRTRNWCRHTRGSCWISSPINFVMLLSHSLETPSSSMKYHLRCTCIYQLHGDPIAYINWRRQSSTIRSALHACVSSPSAISHMFFNLRSSPKSHLRHKWNQHFLTVRYVL
jgi:hypothetical protein